MIKSRFAGKTQARTCVAIKEATEMSRRERKINGEKKKQTEILFPT